MKKAAILILLLTLAIFANSQIINPDFETWTTDAIAPPAMNPNEGIDTWGWWDYNYFNSPNYGSSPVSITQSTDPVHSGTYSVRIESQKYTATSWNIYKTWGIPYIGHQYNDTLGILFNGKVELSEPYYTPGIAFTERISQFKFYYQYQPNGVDEAECRVELLSDGTSVAGGVFSTNETTGASGWQQAVIDMVYYSELTPDTIYVLFSATSLDEKPQVGSVLWVDDISVTLPTGIEKVFGEENGIDVYPNPTKDWLHININDSRNIDKLHYSLVDLKGNVLKNGKMTNNKEKIDVKNLPSNVYILQLYKDKKMMKSVKISKIE